MLQEICHCLKISEMEKSQKKVKMKYDYENTCFFHKDMLDRLLKVVFLWGLITG